ncbi:hypothetical protein M011DRAFT_529327 [Sporormia fimetaria CBS 119925]|uniref:Uncharacterized protein n=1 Tax=Sporormia fimetaria CBS 119925 TaxID=1340428 RepID=A0A6A6V0D9_9PLEO|nr:hypothetical protein M011DRAFT_529327 [Sporormia fimetaria CBS 119925]
MARSRSSMARNLRIQQRPGQGGQRNPQFAPRYTEEPQDDENEVDDYPQIPRMQLNAYGQSHQGSHQSRKAHRRPQHHKGHYSQPRPGASGSSQSRKPDAQETFHAGYYAGMREGLHAGHDNASCAAPQPQSDGNGGMENIDHGRARMEDDAAYWELYERQTPEPEKPQQQRLGW